MTSLTVVLTGAQTPPRKC